MGEGKLQRKVALVTGAGSGIGRAVASLFGLEGATVIVSDKVESAARAVSKGIIERGRRAEALRLDVTGEAAWRETTERILLEHSRLDVVVNNAGLSMAGAVEEMPYEEWRRLMAVNLDGVFLGTKHAIRAMRRSRGKGNAGGRGGSIVNVASVSGIVPQAGAAAYSASKAAVRILSKAAAMECEDERSGIRVNVVSPGGVKTPMWETQPFFRGLVAEHGGVEEAFRALEGDAPSERFFSPDEVARTVLYLASDEASHLNGVEIVLGRGHVG